MINKPKIAILDYGVGNLHSVIKAFKKFNEGVFVTEDADAINSSDALVLPGVGSFAAGMEGLKIRNLTGPVKKFAASGRSILGICLGAQIMLSKGYEFGEHEGLGLIAGKVTAFPELEKGARLPHIGWEKISPRTEQSWKKSVLQTVDKNSYVYFVHSYVMLTDDEKNTFAYSRYGGHEFSAVIKKDNIYGCQFHPEKSGKAGLAIINDFINLI